MCKCMCVSSNVCGGQRTTSNSRSSGTGDLRFGGTVSLVGLGLTTYAGLASLALVDPSLAIGVCFL